MKILLKSLTMVNFMGEPNRTTTFNLDCPTTIAGMNGLGKSRHFDAFMWLMFGKDAADRKDYEIKSIVDGKPLQRCECSVSAELVVDGEIITIKRSFVEQWVKPRGCAEQIFKGNQTECTWNDVPVKVGEFQKRINDIVDETLFKMLTNPLFFATMPWKNQREQLFQLAGNIDTADIVKSNPAFIALMERINGKPLADFKKEMAFKKSRLKAELDTIQPKIDQTNALMPAPVNVEAIRAEIAAIDAEIASVDAQIADVTAAIRAAFDAEKAKIREIGDIKRQMADIENAMANDARDAAFKANEHRADLLREITALTRERQSLAREHESATRRRVEQQTIIANAEALRTRIENERDALRAEVIAEKGKRYDGSTLCPVCGQQLPDEKIAAAEADFNTAQNQKIARMVERGRAMNDDIARQTAHITEAQREIAGIDGELADIERKADAIANDIREIQTTVDGTPEIKPAPVDPATNPEWIALRDKAASIEQTLNATTVTASPDTNGLNERKAGLNARRAEAVTLMANDETIRRYKNAVADLEKRGHELVQQIADIERDEFTMAEFNAAHINECERRINGMFHHVTFRLFDYTIDGNAVETCVPLVNGVPFGRTNTAGRINAGLDIINALCRHYGTDAPIFLDNAESVNQFIETNGQVIMMRVTTDPELIIK